MNNEVMYKNKYLKYKTKYLQLKKTLEMRGGNYTCLNPNATYLKLQKLTGTFLGTMPTYCKPKV